MRWEKKREGCGYGGWRVPAYCCVTVPACGGDARMRVTVVALLAYFALLCLEYG